MQISGTLFLSSGTGQVVEFDPPTLEVMGSGVIAPGTAPSAALGTLIPAAIDVTSGSANLTFTLANVGEDPLTFGASALSITGPAAADFTVTSGALPASLAGGSGSATVSITFNPTLIGTRTATINIASNDPNQPLFSVNVSGTGSSIDSSAPTLTATAPADCDAPQGLVFPLTWSEPVTGFTLADIQLSGATATALTGSGASYELTAAATSSGALLDRVALTVTAAAATDVVGNQSSAFSAPNLLTCANALTAVMENASVALAGAESRANAITVLEPQIRQRMTEAGDQRQTNEVSLQAFGDNQGDFARGLLSVRGVPSDYLSSAGAGPNRKLDGWVRAEWAREKTDETESDSATIYLGADYRLSEDLLLGGLLHLDWAESIQTRTINATPQTETLTAKGWMLGPYAVYRLPQGLTLDGRIAWGQTISDFEKNGSVAEDLKADRFLARAQVSGEVQLTERLRLTPDVRYLTYHEWHNAYTDDLNVSQPERHFSQNQVSFGPRLSYTHTSRQGVLLEPFVELRGAWQSRSAEDDQGGFDGKRQQRWSTRLDAGIRAITARSVSVYIDGFLDGLFENNRTGYGGGLTVRVPLH